MHIIGLLAVVTLVGGWGCGGGGGGEESAEANMEVLMDPTHAALSEKAPDNFRARFETSGGVFVIEVDRDLALTGVDRFYNLVRNGFYDDLRFFRVEPGFVVQWGMHADPEVTAKWMTATMADDPVKGSNTRGTITYAKTREPNSRTTQMFINLSDNSGNLDGQGFAAFGRIVEGMEVVDAINSEYGGRPNQQQIHKKGNKYLNKLFPNLDYIKRASID